MGLYGLHRIFYRELPDGIAVELVVHQRQDFPPLLEPLSEEASDQEVE